MKSKYLPLKLEIDHEHKSAKLFAGRSKKPFDVTAWKYDEPADSLIATMTITVPVDSISIIAVSGVVIVKKPNLSA